MDLSKAAAYIFFKIISPQYIFPVYIPILGIYTGTANTYQGFFVELGKLNLFRGKLILENIYTPEAKM